MLRPAGICADPAADAMGSGVLSFSHLMKLSRPSRFFAALLTIFSLLFTQLAVAAYACPNLKLTPMSMSPGAGMEAMSGCTRSDAQQPGLCKAHCDRNQQTLDVPSAPHVTPFVAASLSCVLPAPGLAPPVYASFDASLTLQHATAPPIAIRHCCFRI